MAASGTILLADDEVNFRQATAELLREEGYQCDEVPDAAEAIAQLQQDTYDVLIADIKMPGNVNLEFIRTLAESGPGLFVILVTGYPSTETAIDSVQLPVSAYLVKPFKFEELLTHVQFGVMRSNAQRAVHRLQGQVKAWQQEMEVSAQAVSSASREAFSDPVGVFLETSFRRVMQNLHELEQMTAILARHEHEKQEISYQDPRVDHLKAALVDTIGVLEKTKHAFKSKDLGALRRRLENIITQVDSSS